MSKYKYINRICLRLGSRDNLIHLDAGYPSAKIRYTVKQFKSANTLVRLAYTTLVAVLVSVGVSFMVVSSKVITSSSDVYDTDTRITLSLLFGGLSIILAVIVAFHVTSLLWMIKNIHKQ